MHGSFAAPAERMTQRRHAHEEIFVLTAACKYWIEHFLQTVNDLAVEQQITGARLLPAHDPPRWMFRPLAKTPIDDPARRRLLEIGPYGAQNPGNLIFLAG